MNNGPMFPIYFKGQFKISENFPREDRKAYETTEAQKAIKECIIDGLDKDTVVTLTNTNAISSSGANYNFAVIETPQTYDLFVLESERSVMRQPKHLFGGWETVTKFIERVQQKGIEIQELCKELGIQNTDLSQLPGRGLEEFLDGKKPGVAKDDKK